MFVILAFVAAFLGLAGASLVARASTGPVADSASTTMVCTLGAPASLTFDQIRNRNFDCGPDRFERPAERVWAVLPVHGAEQLTGPLELRGDNLYLEGAEVHAVYADGSSRSVRYTMEQIRDGSRPKGVYALPIPQSESGSPLQRVYAGFDRPWSATTAKLMHIASTSEGDARQLPVMVMFGVLFGFAVLPLLYNFFFFAALRYRFLVWHSLMVVATAAYTFSSSGMLFLVFPEAGLGVRHALNYWTLALGVSAGAVFLIHYLEEGMIGRRLTVALVVTALLPVMVTATVLHTGDWARFVGRTWYHASFLPAFAVSLAAILTAWRRGSRAVRFQMLGWLPIILVALERIARGLDLYQGFAIMDYALYFVLVFDSSIVALGVADRVLRLRESHDESSKRADRMARLAETDGLTGLANRRGFDRIFEESQRKRSHDELAIVDIDHFKQINDEYGHECGDNVLRAIGGVLADSGLVAARLGGEEFALLIRNGEDAIGPDLEALRKRISSSIALAVPRVTTPITVSIGVAPIMRGIPSRAIYALADRRLYAAKRGGRDRIERDAVAFDERAA
ncbi:MAG: diguanylate cyclase [Blastomonas sp.]